jgi:hypothetical protein
MLRRLYVRQKLTLKETAAKLGTSRYTIRRALRDLGIPSRPGGYTIPAKVLRMKALQVGEYLTLTKRTSKNKYNYFYQTGQRLGIRLSVKSVDESCVRVRRVK